MKFFSKIFQYVMWKTGFLENHDISLVQHFEREAANSGNALLDARNLCRFSQADEAGILDQMLSRIQFKDKGRFVEFGIGNGTENNSLDLLLAGWEVWWFGNETLQITIPNSFTSLKYTKDWITLKKITVLAREILDYEPDIISMDLDGNDYHFARKLLETGLRPLIWVQEYNATFGPKTKWVMPYKENHSWDLSNNWGASFASYVELLETFGYKLVTCNLTGVNAFFIRIDLMGFFPESQVASELKFRNYQPWFLKSRQRVNSELLFGIY
jgi:hypothetical protein